VYALGGGAAWQYDYTCEHDCSPISFNQGA
jgi:hypothetical protein